MKKQLTALAVLLSTLTTPAVIAGELEEHKHLWETIGSVGVETVLNNKECFREGMSGYYYQGELVVCQDNYEGYGEVSWTENDLDTLRHEAHHLVQDCLDKSIDNELRLLFNTSEEFTKFLEESSLTEEQLMNIYRAYKADGADAHDIRLELEAFAVAEDVDAISIANAVEHFCSPVRLR